MKRPAPPLTASGPLAILQLHDRFDGSEKDKLVLRLMNHWGGKARHDILLSDRGANDARTQIDPGVQARFLAGPPFGATGGPGRFVALAQVMRNYDLVLSYGWGGIDGAMTQRLLGLLMNLPPVIHHEDGSQLEGTGPPGLRSDFYRRMSLPSVHALVVPSVQLAHVAIDKWNMPPARVKQIPNGIDVAAFAGGQARVTRFAPDGRLAVGVRLGNAAPEMLDALLRATAPLKETVRLIVLDAPGESAALTARAAALGIDDLLVPDQLPPAQDYLGGLDLFVLLSPDEPCPRKMVEAMAAGLPVIASDSGDVSAMLASANRPLIVKPGDEARWSAALARLVGNAELRATLGEANRRRAAQCFDENGMFALYSRLYGEAAGRSEALL